MAIDPMAIETDEQPGTLLPNRVDDSTVSPALEPAPQFGLRGLLGMFALLSVMFGLLRALDIYGLLLIFAGFLVFVFVTWNTERRGTQRLIFDLMAGIILPTACVAFDPIFNPQHRLLLIAYTGWQMSFLAVWLCIGRGLGPPIAGALSGIFWSGAGIALLIALGLTPLSFLGLIVLVGALGFIPWFTFRTYLRCATECERVSRLSRQAPICLLLGVALSLTVPYGNSKALKLAFPRGIPSITSSFGFLD